VKEKPSKQRDMQRLIEENLNAIMLSICQFPAYICNKTNRMKTKILFLSSCLIAASASAQVDFSLRSGLACGKGSTIGQTYTATGNTFTRSNLNGSYGSGIPVTAMAVIPIDDCFKWYVMFDYLCGRPVLVDDYSGSSLTNLEEVRSKLFSFGTGARFEFFNEGRLRPYGQLGVSAPVIGRYDHYGTQTFGNNTIEWTERTRLRPGYGCDAEGGLNLRLTDRFGLVAGVGGSHLNLFPIKTELTRYDVNGTDDLANRSVYQSMVNYRKEINENSNISGNSNFDQDQASDQLRSYSPFSNTRVFVGIRGSF